MLVAKLETGREVIAWQTNKQEAPFLCPTCGSRLTLKQGNARIHHFAHTSDSNCLHGSGETQEHLNAKKSIYEALAANSRVTKLALERDLQTVRPDISCYIDQIRVAIEIQRSDLHIQTVVRRIYQYQRMKIALLWVLTSPPTVGPTLVQEWTREDCVRLKDWQRYLKTLYYNRLYYFAGGDQVSAFSFYAWEVEKGFGWNNQGDGSWDHDYTGLVKLKNTWAALYHGDFSIIEHGSGHLRKKWNDVQAAYLWKI